MFKDILVPYDGSDSANRALATAIQIATGDEPVDITVLQAAGISDTEQSSFEVAMRMAGLTSKDGNELDSLRETFLSVHNEQIQEQVSKYFDSLPENINIRIVVKRGNPRDVICSYAEENDIDSIIMGRRGIGGIRATLGSVSTGVLRSTDLPVLVIK